MARYAPWPLRRQPHALEEPLKPGVRADAVQQEIAQPRGNQRPLIEGFLVVLEGPIFFTQAGVDQRQQDRKDFFVAGAIQQLL